MAAYKETNRQKMISMMYLVLTAMLALNVSKELIDAFTVVNESILESATSTSNKIDQVYSNFEFQQNLNPVKVEPIWRKAKLAKQLSTDMQHYLKAVKDTTIMLAEHKTLDEIKKYVGKNIGIDPKTITEIPLAQLRNKDSYDETSHYFVPNPEETQKSGKALEIKLRFKEFRENMHKLVPTEMRDHFKIGPNFEANYYDANGLRESWEKHNFYHTIMAADITILNKLIVDVQHAELDILNYLYRSINEENFKFTNIEAKVIPKSSYVLLGETYTADVIVAAYDSTQRPEVYIQHGVDRITDINKAVKIRNNKDIASLDFKSDKTGEHKYAGLVQMRSPSGELNKYYFNDSYFVGGRSATVSATKMNVLYKGVDNPLSISVPGVPTSQIRPTINKGELTKNNDGTYTAKIPGNVSGNAIIKVSAIIDGKESVFASHEYRVRDIPNPMPTVGGTFTSGEVSKDFLNISSIIAKTPENFDFDYTFRIVGFVMWYLGSDGYWVQLASNNHEFTPEMKSLFSKLPVNSRIQFEQIRVQAPEGVRELASTISIKIK